MDELKYIKGLVRELYDLWDYIELPEPTVQDIDPVFARIKEIEEELKELSGFNKDE